MAKQTKTSNKAKNENMKDVEKVENNIEKAEQTEIEALKRQLEEMKQTMLNMMANQNKQVVVTKEDEEVVVGCRVLQGIGWGDPNDTAGEVRLKYNQTMAIPKGDMKKFFRTYNVKRIFEDGLCYFENPDDYISFGIQKAIDLSDENLKRILNLPTTNDIVFELSKMTSEKKNSNTLNCLIYRICDMIRKNELKWDYYTRKGVEGYLGVEFDKGISTLTALDNIRG